VVSVWGFELKDEVKEVGEGEVNNFLGVFWGEIHVKEFDFEVFFVFLV